MVVLSACESALGRVDREGVFGLQTAFQLAGARTVVASLWKVEDRATQALMSEFYRNLWEENGVGRLEALRRAQLWTARPDLTGRPTVACMLVEHAGIEGDPDGHRTAAALEDAYATTLWN